MKKKACDYSNVMDKYCEQMMLWKCIITHISYLICFFMRCLN